MICIGLFNYFQFNQNNLEIKSFIEQEKVKNDYYIISQEEIIERDIENKIIKQERDIENKIIKQERDIENKIIIEQEQEITINRIINKTLNNIIDTIVITVDEEIINDEICKIINNILN